MWNLDMTHNQNFVAKVQTLKLALDSTQTWIHLARETSRHKHKVRLTKNLGRSRLFSHSQAS